MAGGVTYSRLRLPGAVNLSSTSIRTLLRGSTDVVHSGAGTITTNVDVTSANIISLTKAIEHLTGYAQTAGVNGYLHAKLILTSTTNLQIVTIVDKAMTITVGWEILEALGSIQRIEVSGTSGASGVTVNTTITNVVNLGNARIYNNGEGSSSIIGFRMAASHNLTTTTNLQTKFGFGATGYTLTAPVVIEY